MRADMACGRAVAGLLWIGMAVAGPRPAAAQDAPRCEIGTSVGATIISVSGESNTHFGIPGGIGPLSPFSPVLYASIFATPSVMVEPQVSLSTVSGGGSTTTFFTVVGQLGYLFSPDQRSSPYLAGCVAFQRAGGGGSSVSGTGAGGEVGYRFTIGSSLAMRVNARYRRWFSDFAETNEIGFAVGLGGVL
jgi:hypothetical protein